MDWYDPPRWVVFLCFAIIFILVWMMVGAVTSRCPRCRRWDALELTGNTDVRTSMGIFGRRLRPQREWKCEHCDHVVWKRDRGDGGGYD